MKRKRRTISSFSLSFLDIMFCGFGAVVLLVLLLNGDTVRLRREASGELQAEAAALDSNLAAAAARLAAARLGMREIVPELESAEVEKQALEEKLRSSRQGASSTDRQARSHMARVELLKAELRKLEQENVKLREKRDAARGEGRRVRRFLGEGDRQYLTGLKLGGKRVSILLDSSASMLDETLVNIVIKKNSPPATRRKAPKWRRALATVEWLVANLPGNSSYQVHTFDTRAKPADSATGWLPVSDGARMDAVFRSLQGVAPQGGTSLYHAFKALGAMKPRPDNIILITDGLPTQGRSKPTRATVTSSQRLKLFGKAVEALPKGVPVNTILLPMEGDAYAAAAFWELAIRTRGSFMTPTRDWP